MDADKTGVIHLVPLIILTRKEGQGRLPVESIKSEPDLK